MRPYEDANYNGTFRYCGKTRYCKTQNPYDVDIAGIGVLISFGATAAFTLLTIVLGYLCEWLPGTYTNHVDDAVISTITTFISFCCKPSLERIRDRITSPSIRTKRHPSKQAKIWSTALERFILAMSDQQLGTGVAILITIFTKTCEISIYSFQIAAALAWFSSTTHLATLTILTSYFDNHRVARNVRAFVMLCLMVMLAAAQIMSNSESVQHSSTDAFLGCALKLDFRLAPASGYEAINLSLLIAWLLTSYSSRMISLYFPHHSSTQRWPTRQLAHLLRLELEKATEEDDSQARLENVSRAVDDHLCNGPLRRWPLVRRFCCAYMYFFTLAGIIERAFINSFLWHLMWLFFGATFGIGQVISIRKSWTIPSRKDQEVETLNNWNFGQILPLVLLALPALTGLEAYFETKDEIEGFPAQSSALSITSKEDGGFQMAPLACSNQSHTVQPLPGTCAKPDEEGLVHDQSSVTLTSGASIYEFPLARFILVFYIFMWLVTSQLVAVSAATNFSGLGLMIPLVLVLSGFYIWSVIVYDALELFKAFRRKKRRQARASRIVET